MSSCESSDIEFEITGFFLVTSEGNEHECLFHQSCVLNKYFQDEFYVLKGEYVFRINENFAVPLIPLPDCNCCGYCDKCCVTYGPSKRVICPWVVSGLVWQGTGEIKCAYMYHNVMEAFREDQYEKHMAEEIRLMEDALMARKLQHQEDSKGACACDTSNMSVS